MRVIGYLLAGALLFAGCTEDKPREPDPTSRPSPTATAPSMPAAAQENTEAGAIAFVKHYVNVFNYASNTGDVKELQRLSDPKCEGCNSYIDLYEETYADGGYFKHSDWVLDDPSAEQQGAELIIFAHLTAPKGEYRSSAASDKKAGMGEDTDVTFVPKTRGMGWVLDELGLQPKETS